MIFGHSIAECRKAVIAAVIFIFSAVALFVAYDPSLKEAVIVLVGNGFAVVAVFAAPKFSIDDLTKMLGQLVGSVQSVLTFFVVINPNVWVVIGSVISLIPIGYAVYRTKNLAPINVEVPPVLGGPPVIPAGALPTESAVTVASPRADLPTVEKPPRAAGGISPVADGEELPPAPPPAE